MLKRIFLLVFIQIFISACSTVTTRTSAVGLNEWRVETKVNGYTTKETAIVSWYYKAAKLTLDKGYDGFSGAVSSILHKPLDHEILKTNNRLLNIYRGRSQGSIIKVLHKPLKNNNPSGHYRTQLDSRKIVSILEPWMNKKCSSARTICLDAYKELYEYLHGY